MLDFLNPCNTDGANWQHWLMLALPFLLGLLFGKGSDNNEEGAARLEALEADLANCHNHKKSILASAKPSVNSISEKTEKETVKIIETVKVVETVTPAAIVSAVSSSKDDLKIVEGIGPKIEGLFNDAGIHTFAQLANTPASQLKEILNAAGPRYQMHNPETWPAQSKMASEGKWDQLKAWQEELNKGK